MRRLSIRSGPLAYIAAFAITISVSLLLLPFRNVFEAGHVALVVLLAVWASAALAGVGPGLFAAALGFAVLYYAYVPPYYHPSVADPTDWLTLGVFLTVATIQGLQTGRMREREQRANEAELDAEALATLAGQLVSESSARAVGEIVTTEVARATGAGRVAVLVRDDTGDLELLADSQGASAAIDAGVERFSDWVVENGIAVGIPSTTRAAGDDEPSETQVESVEHDAVVPGADRRDIFLPVSTPAGTEGVLYIGPRPGRGMITGRGVRFGVSLTRLLGAFLERHRLQQIAGQAETVREAERLKSTLVSSVSHELKTPLAAMTATVSGLLASDTHIDDEHLRQDLMAVDDGLKRLAVSIGDLLDISRLESDAWQARREPYEVSEIVGSLVGRLNAGSRSRISVELPEDLPAIEVDFVQWSRALSNILENALAYSGPEGGVRIGARSEVGTVWTWIEDDGPGIPADERPLVFEKFYRGSTAARVPSGTGLGLTIAQEIVRFNGGTIDVEAAWPHGARFLVSAPAVGAVPTTDADADVAASDEVDE